MTEKALRAGGLTRQEQADQVYPVYFEWIEEHVDYADLFHPAFWRHHTRLKPLSMIRLRHVRGHFDVFVTVKTAIAGGVAVEFHSGRPPAGIDPYKVAAEGLADGLKLRPVPLRDDGKPSIYIQFLPKTKWRLVAGNAEIKRDMNTEEEAKTELAIYLNQLGLRIPTDEERLEHAVAVNDARAARELAPAK